MDELNDLLKLVDREMRIILTREKCFLLKQIARPRVTRVCNVKVAFIRPKYRNLQEWCADENNVYVGRKVFRVNGSFDSEWRNPFKPGKDGTIEIVLKKYEDRVRNLIASKELDIETLRGKNLGCWCKPAPCHGDVLMKILEEN